MSPTFRVCSPYSPDEVSVLIHSYLELRECSSQFVRTRLMDISRCIKMLNWNERHAVFIIGVARCTSRECGALLGISHTHSINHYNSGREKLLRYMNGAYDQ